MNDPYDDRGRAGFDADEDDNLSVPAGTRRVVLGLMMMAGGVLAAALSDNAWVKYAGAIIFLASFLVMLKSPDRLR
jgi:hypothetical protein